MDTKPPVKFDLSFTPLIESYIEECKASKTKITVKGFAKKIGCDVYDLWAWADKKKKDDKGNVTDDLSRPKFHEGLTKLDKLEKEDTPESFTTKQELFCLLYVTDAAICGNATQCYIKAYGLDQSNEKDYHNARVSSSNLLANLSIKVRMNEILQAQGFNNEFIDSQLLYLVKQNEDLSTKRGAINDYNKLQQRIIDKIDHTTKGDKIVPILGGSASAISSDNSN
jgi:hypothetical protein